MEGSFSTQNPEFCYSRVLPAKVSVHAKLNVSERKAIFSRRVGAYTQTHFSNSFCINRFENSIEWYFKSLNWAIALYSYVIIRLTRAKPNTILRFRVLKKQTVVTGFIERNC